MAERFCKYKQKDVTYNEYNKNCLCVPTDTVLARSDARMHIVSLSTHLLQKIRPNNVVHACVKPAKKHKNKDNI